MRFRKKPVVIDAVQWNGSNVADIQQFMGGNPSLTLVAGNLEIHTLEGTMRADVGDWIICGIKGEYYPCKPDIFDATYEAEP